MSAGGPGSWADVPFGPGVSLAAGDANGLGALIKPAGVLSHPNGPRDEARALVRAPYDRDRECFEWASPGDGTERVWLINRLDSATSGLILAARGEAIAREVRNRFKRQGIRKVYQALVFGRPRRDSETWRDVLEVRKQGGRIRTVAGGGNLPAESRMSLVRAGAAQPRLSLIRLEPQTGRSHQLRVQCAKRGLPIVGDQTYGNFAANRAFAKALGSKRMFLHSFEVSFDYRIGGASFAFSAQAPLPEDFLRAF
ncbi:MAG TPA: RNA pseudouridine synthase [Opitutaceae bacterium]